MLDVRDGELQDDLAELSIPAVRSLGYAVRTHCWYQEFREIVLKFAVPNIEQLCEPL